MQILRHFMYEIVLKTALKNVLFYRLLVFCNLQFTNEGYEIFDVIFDNFHFLRIGYTLLLFARIYAIKFAQFKELY